jgi:hypothetical protein
VVVLTINQENADRTCGWLRAFFTGRKKEQAGGGNRYGDPKGN